MDQSFLVIFKWIVIGAMFAALGMIALVCGYYFLRWQAFRPFLPARRPRQKKPAEEEADETEGSEASEEPVKDKAAKAAPATRFGGAQDEASFLDAESSDPEIQLDLARAYISMGDKEAARAILEEVVTTGSEEQQAEAQKMLDLM